MNEAEADNHLDALQRRQQRQQDALAEATRRTGDDTRRGMSSADGAEGEASGCSARSPRGVSSVPKPRNFLGVLAQARAARATQEREAQQAPAPTSTQQQQTVADEAASAPSESVDGRTATRKTTRSARLQGAAVGLLVGLGMGGVAVAIVVMQMSSEQCTT
jgi:hypothetical protein